MSQPETVAGLARLHDARQACMPRTAHLRCGLAVLCSSEPEGLPWQDVLAVVSVAHMPGLRSLRLGVAAAPEGSNARPIVVGCRGPHPDLSQLARLDMAPSINLCVNFLRYLSSLPGISLSESLERAVDAYLGRRQSLMFVLMFGHHEEEQARPRLACPAGPVAALCTSSKVATEWTYGLSQHGFLAGELMIQFEGEEESDENE